MIINFKGTALAVAAVATLSVGAAQASFTAYNDGLWQNKAYFGTLLPNVTNIQEPHVATGNTVVIDEVFGGNLKDFNTGATLGAYVTISQSGGVCYESGDFGSMACATGTDAYNAFNGIVDLNGFIRYGNTGWWYDLEFSGLNPNATYEFVGTANRGSSGYTTRWSKFTIMSDDAFAFTNASSAGTISSGATTAFCSGYNSANGYIAKWTGITTGADGKFKIRTQADMVNGTSNSCYAIQAFRLKEISPAVPEPGSMLALASGLFGLGGFAIRRRK